MRALLLVVLLLGCQASPQSSARVSLSVTPTALTRPCLVRKIAVYDDLGAEYRAADGDCNDSVIELPPGRTFSGFEFHSDQVEDITVYLIDP